MVDFWIDISICIQKYWWLRSPYPSSDGNAWFVSSFGVVGNFNGYYNVDRSYGRNLIT